MWQVNDVLEDSGKDATERRTVGCNQSRTTDTGSKAMTDSAAIYLSYAKYVAYGMPDSEEMIEDEIQG